VTYAIRNQGDASAAGSLTRVTVSSLRPPQSVVHTEPAVPLAAGVRQGYSALVNGTCPAMPIIVVVADENSVVEESDETNNLAAREFGPPCEIGTALTCDGVCPLGMSCVDSDTGCACASNCALGSDSMCSGTGCPYPDQVCTNTGSGCSCVDPGQQCSYDASRATCAGFCDAGSVCTAAGSGICVCSTALPCEESGQPTCGGLCAAGTICALEAAAGGCGCVPRCEYDPIDNACFSSSCPPDAQCIIVARGECGCVPLSDICHFDVGTAACVGPCSGGLQCGAQPGGCVCQLPCRDVNGNCVGSCSATGLRCTGQAGACMCLPTLSPPP